MKNSFQKNQLYLIDGIGPFFRKNQRKEINWSKIDFQDFEKKGTISKKRCEKVKCDFKTFATKAATIGYNAITLDDLAHLVPDTLYSEKLNTKIEQYKSFYRELFQIAIDAGLQIFITTDLLFFTQETERFYGRNQQRMRTFIRRKCLQFFKDFPEVAGIIFRIGESDGIDVDGDFKSRLVLKKPAQAKQMLQSLLPVFENKNKLLIFRTWTVGISKLGDLIWSKETFKKIFEKIHSPNLIISMKYGESDFFRYLPLNKLFHESDHQKIIELQCRREYEGFGQFPSFTGNDYEKINSQLISARNMVGISVWCQTGGWSGFRSLTFLEPTGIWNEINTFTTLRIFRDNISAAQAIQAFCKERLNRSKWIDLYELLNLSEKVIKDLLYIDEFATRQIFFRRLRIPPLINVYWKHILVSHLLRKLLRCYVSKSSGEELVRRGYKALPHIRQMKKIATEIDLPTECFDFQYDTFRIIAVARAYLFLSHPESTLVLLEKMKQNYENKWPEPRYALQIDTNPFPLRRAHLKKTTSILFRRQHDYRLTDRILALTFYAMLQPIIRRANKKIFPKFTQDQAMGINTIFK